MSLENGEVQPLLAGATSGQWVESAKAMVHRIDQRIFAQAFDPVALTFSGEPVRIGGPVRTKTFPNQGHMSVANDETLVSLEGAVNDSDSERIWVDREGKALDRWGYLGL